MKVTIRGKELDIDINKFDPSDDLYVPVNREEIKNKESNKSNSTVTNEDLDKELSEVEFLDDLSVGDDDDKTAENWWISRRISKDS